MRKFLLIVAAVPWVLTGCLKNDTYHSKLDPVAPGMRIYKYVAMQNQISLQPAEVGIRLAMLLAEAKKQNKMGDLESVTVKDVRVKAVLFGPMTEIEKTDYGYKITYKNSRGMTSDDFIRNGAFRIRTNGAEQLAQTESGGNRKWVVTIEDDVTLRESMDQGALTIADGLTTLYNKGEGIYRIDVAGFQAYASSEAIKSNWYGGYDWRPGHAELIYSEFFEKESVLNGEGSGESCYSFDLEVPTNMRYRIAEGLLPSYRRIEGGVETAELLNPGDYNPSEYPSPKVTIDRRQWPTWIVTWNDITVTVP